MQTSISPLSYNLFANNLNQNYGTRFDFNFIALAETYVVVLITSEQPLA